jgi:acyl-CoA synthetase (AMP-forming)/AMP-acid ligase II
LNADLEKLTSVADISRLHGREQPDKVAMKFEGRNTTYRELDRYSNQVANGLMTLGQKPGKRIGFLGKNQDRFWEVALGCFKSRTAMMSVNWRLAPAEVPAGPEDSHSPDWWSRMAWLP